jgi:hypothetical protein
MFLPVKPKDSVGCDRYSIFTPVIVRCRVILVEGKFPGRGTENRGLGRAM